MNAEHVTDPVQQCPIAKLTPISQLAYNLWQCPGAICQMPMCKSKQISVGHSQYFYVTNVFFVINVNNYY